MAFFENPHVPSGFSYIWDRKRNLVGNHISISQRLLIRIAIQKSFLVIYVDWKPLTIEDVGTHENCLHEYIVYANNDAKFVLHGHYKIESKWLMVIEQLFKMVHSVKT